MIYKTRFKYKKRLYIKFNEDFRGLYLTTHKFRSQLRNYYYFFFYRRYIYNNINNIKYNFIPKLVGTKTQIFVKYKLNLMWANQLSRKITLKKFAICTNQRDWRFFVKYWYKKIFIKKLVKFKNLSYFRIKRRLKFFLWRVRKLKKILSWAKFCIGLQNDPELLKSVMRQGQTTRLDKHTKYLNYLIKKFNPSVTHNVQSTSIWKGIEHKAKPNNLLSLRPKLLLPGFKRNNFQRKRIRFIGINSYKGRFFRLLQLQISLGLIKLPFLKRYVKVYSANINKYQKFARLLNFRLFVFLYNINLCQSLTNAFYIIRLFGININFNWVYYPTALVQANDIFYLPLVLRYYLKRSYTWKYRKMFKFFLKNFPYSILFNFKSGAFLLQPYKLDTIKFGKIFHKIRFNGRGRERSFDSINSNTYIQCIKYFNRR